MYPKQQLNIKIPGKTFLLGEYLALFGGPSIVVAHQPCFEFVFDKSLSDKNLVSFFHPQSPAGLWVNKYKEEFSQWHVHAHDPYKGSGGFGASTAQFLAVWNLRSWCREEQFLGSQASIVSAWKDYRQLFAESATKPSGADLIAQASGGMCVWNETELNIKKIENVFTDLKIELYKTPYKINTHTHLEQMNQGSLPREELLDICKKAIESLLQNQATQFLQHSQTFSDVLKKEGLVSADTQELLQHISRNSEVLHARGCGALGADVIAVYSDKSSQLNFNEYGLTRIIEIPQGLSSGVLGEFL